MWNQVLAGEQGGRTDVIHQYNSHRNLKAGTATCMYVYVCVWDKKKTHTTNLLATSTRDQTELLDSWTDLKKFIKHYSDSHHFKLCHNDQNAIWVSMAQHSSLSFSLTLYRLSCCCKGSTGSNVHKLKVYISQMQCNFFRDAGLPDNGKYPYSSTQVLTQT